MRRFVDAGDAKPGSIRGKASETVGALACDGSFELVRARRRLWKEGDEWGPEDTLGRGLVSLWRQLPHDGWKSVILEGTVLMSKKACQGGR